MNPICSGASCPPVAGVLSGEKPHQQSGGGTALTGL